MTFTVERYSMSESEPNQLILIIKYVLIIIFISLEEINLGDCLLRTKGAVLIGEALQDEHLALERLNLDHNEIGANGGYAIASAMQNKEQLQSLNLNGNQVSLRYKMRSF